MTPLKTKNAYLAALFWTPAPYFQHFSFTVKCLASSADIYVSFWTLKVIYFSCGTCVSRSPDLSGENLIFLDPKLETKVT